MAAARDPSVSDHRSCPDPSAMIAGRDCDGASHCTAASTVKRQSAARGLPGSEEVVVRWLTEVVMEGRPEKESLGL